MAEKDYGKNYLVLVIGERVVRLLWWSGLKKAVSIFDKRSKLELFLQEFLTNLDKIGSLNKVLGENPLESLNAEDSELNEKSYDNKNSYSQAMMSFFIDPTPFKKEAIITPLLPAVDVHKTSPTPHESWFFLNGIGTNEDMAKVNARMLSNIFMRPITPLHNPTNGFIADLEEVMEGRAFNHTSIAKSAKDHIWGELQKSSNRKVVVIAHSQGGIIISNVVRMLLQEHNDSPLLSKLEVYTFASAHDDYPSPSTSKHTPFDEHFANDDDFVAQVGVLNPDSQTPGDVFIKKGAGHLLNFHYLRDFDHGKYGKGSRLFSLRNGKRKLRMSKS